MACVRGVFVVTRKNAYSPHTFGGLSGGARVYFFGYFRHRTTIVVVEGPEMRSFFFWFPILPLTLTHRHKHAGRVTTSTAVFSKVFVSSLF